MAVETATSASNYTDIMLYLKNGVADIGINIREIVAEIAPPKPLTPPEPIMPAVPKIDIKPDPAPFADTNPRANPFGPDKFDDFDFSKLPGFENFGAEPKRPMAPPPPAPDKFDDFDFSKLPGFENFGAEPKRPMAPPPPPLKNEDPFKDFDFSKLAGFGDFKPEPPPKTTQLPDFKDLKDFNFDDLFKDEDK